MIVMMKYGKLVIVGMILGLMTVQGCACDVEPLNRIPVVEVDTDKAVIDFGEVLVGVNVTQTFKIANTGDKPFYVDRMVLFPQSGAFVIENAQAEVLPGEETTLTVHFRPTHEIDYAAKLSLLYNKEAGPLSEIQLLGSGITETVCTSCDSTQSYCFDTDTSMIYEHLGGCEEDQCLYEMIAIACECGCDDESGDCAICPEEEPVVEEPPTSDPAQCTFIREGYEQYEWLGCLPGQTCDLENRDCLGNSIIGNLEEAMSYCEELEYAGHNDWVLPTIDQQKVLFTGCDGLPQNYPGDSCEISHGCSYVGDDASYNCGCEDGNTLSCLHQICESCEIGAGPGEDGYYTAPGYFGMSANTASCSSDFFTRTLRNVNAFNTVVTMRPTTGYIQSGSHITNNSRWTCVREIEPACGDGHIQIGEECDDGNDVEHDSCDNDCRRTL